MKLVFLLVVVVVVVVVVSQQVAVEVCREQVGHEHAALVRLLGVLGLEAPVDNGLPLDAQRLAALAQVALEQGVDDLAEHEVLHVTVVARHEVPVVVVVGVVVAAVA